MNVGNKLHAGEIDFLVSRLLVGICWLGVFARDELPELTREILHWSLILNTDSNDQPRTHWLAYCAPLAGPIEQFDSFGLSLINYNLHSLDILHLGFSL